MENVIDVEAIKKLPIAARRDLIELIEESIELEEEAEIDDNGYAYETEEELAILNERLEHHRQNPEKAITWDDLKKQLLNSK